MLIVAILGADRGAAVSAASAGCWPWITPGRAGRCSALLVLIFVWPGIRDGAGRAARSARRCCSACRRCSARCSPARCRPARPGSPPTGRRSAPRCVAPFVIGVVFLRAPVLPNSAVEVGRRRRRRSQVVRGQLITVDDTSTTVLQRGGEVVFIPNDQVRSKTLCPEPVRDPEQPVTVRGWAVDASALEWVAPTRPVDRRRSALPRPARWSRDDPRYLHVYDQLSRRAADRVQTGWTATWQAARHDLAPAVGGRHRSRPRPEQQRGLLLRR